MVLTARDEKRGLEAAKNLQVSGFSDVVFHQLDVMDELSIASLANFITNQFGRLDVLVIHSFLLKTFFLLFLINLYCSWHLSTNSYMLRKPQQVNNAGITGTEIKAEDWKNLRFGVEDVSLSVDIRTVDQLPDLNLNR